MIGKTISILGYGAQGSAHAQNMRDEGLKVIVGARKGQSHTNATNDGFDVFPIKEASSQGDLVIIALPDETHEEVINTEILPASRKGEKIIGFLHGASIHFGNISIPKNLGVGLLAPKGPGQTLRKSYLDGKGIPALFAVHQDTPTKNTKEILIAWGSAIGCSRAVLLETTFKDEAIIDLFGEQSVLCGGLRLLIERSFLLLVERGYSPEIAYQECCQEIKQIGDLIYSKGLKGMLDHISTTAAFGSQELDALAREPIDKAFNCLLDKIESGEFIKNFSKDYKNNNIALNDIKTSSPPSIETAGENVRDWMPWLKNKDN